MNIPVMQSQINAGPCTDRQSIPDYRIDQRNWSWHCARTRPRRFRHCAERVWQV